MLSGSGPWCSGECQRNDLRCWCCSSLSLFVFVLTEPDFRTLANPAVILATQSTLVILALAAIFPLIAGQFDLSVAAVMGTSSIAAAGVLSKSHASAGRGHRGRHCHRTDHRAFNGWLVTRVRVNSLIVTLGVATILPGLVDWYSSGLTIESGIPVV